MSILDKTCDFHSDQGSLHFLWKRSKRRRSLAIVIRPEDGVVVYTPFRTSQRDCFRFVEEKLAWIQQNFKDVARADDDPNFKKELSQFWFFGELYFLELSFHNKKRPKLVMTQNKHLQAWLPQLLQNQTSHTIERHLKSAIENWYRLQSEEYLGSRLFYWSRLTGLVPEIVKIKTQKRMWGCCYHRDRKIFLNWQLIFLPRDVIDYVLVHELCHLKVANHSPKFWQLVARYDAMYQKKKQWLKINQYRFRWPRLIEYNGIQYGFVSASVDAA